MAPGRDKLPATGSSSSSDVDRFVQQLRQMPARPGPSAGEASRGRLIFALDATASREPTWDRACHIQGEMFSATEALGGLDVQLVFYRGFRECKASRWMRDTASLLQRMTAVRCLGGQTQIGRILTHAMRESDRQKVDALVFVGDCFEEDIDAVCNKAGELGLRGVPAFMFHEGGDPVAARAFQHVARLTGGAYCPFDLASAEELKRLLGAVAVFAAGGYRALSDYGAGRGEAVRLLTHQLRR